MNNSKVEFWAYLTINGFRLLIVFTELGAIVLGRLKCLIEPT